MMTWVTPIALNITDRDFAGEGALFFPVDILRADRDVGAAGGFDGGTQVNERRADNDLVARVVSNHGQKFRKNSASVPASCTSSSWQR